MFIKYKSLTNEDIMIINVNINNVETITVDKDTLKFNMLGIKDGVTLKLPSNDYAKKSLNMLFENLYNKAPLSNLLDLTNIDSIAENCQYENDNSDFGTILNEEDIQNDIG